MRVYKSRWFAKFARKEHLTDAVLREVVRKVERGVIDADYGGGVIKQRIARLNEGKSGGYRSIILYKKADKAFFVYGFAKNALGNIDKSDERDFKELARILLAATDTELENLVHDGKYQEVAYHDQD